MQDQMCIYTVIFSDGRMTGLAARDAEEAKRLARHPEPNTGAGCYAVPMEAVRYGSCE
jgi:citrate synthase